ncbi:peptidoglycan editing factor PgeF [Dysgonomonas reticulitermitis]
MIESIEHNSLLQFKNLGEFQCLTHFSTTVRGGVSEGDYTSFNLGFYSGDNPGCVYENRSRLASLINVPLQDLYIPYQTHGDKICVLDSDFMVLSDNDKYLSLNGVDALITDQKNICIGVTTADCVPVLIYDPAKNVLATIHAGWKGTVAKIVEKTVAKMADAFGCDPQDMYAGIAPCISQKCFEVGEEVDDVFKEAGFHMNDIAYHNSGTGKTHIDLRQANKILLNNAGVLSHHIETSDLCTYSDSDMFFSARRQTIHSGRMVTGGVLR